MVRRQHVEVLGCGSERSLCVEIVIPIVNIRIQTIDVGNTTLNIHCQSGDTTLANDRIVDSQSDNRICNNRDNRSINHDLATRQRVHNKSVLVVLLISGRRNSQSSVGIINHDLVVIIVPLIGVIKLSRLSNSVEGNRTAFADCSRTINSNSDFRIRNHNNVSVIRDNRDTTRHFKYYDSIVSMCCAISQTRLLVIG